MSIQTMVNALSILDVTLHDPSTDTTEMTVLDIHASYLAVIKIRSTHDQTIRVQFRGDTGRSAIAVGSGVVGDADLLGFPIDVLADDTEMRFLPMDSKPPIIYAECTALVLPTTGSITITVEEYGKVPGT